MSHPIVLSDDEQENVLFTPLPIRPKKPTTEPYPNPSTVFVIDDDTTPQKLGSTSTPLFVAETPMSDLSKSDVSIVKCTTGVSNPKTRISSDDSKLSGVSGLICLESDNESECDAKRELWQENETTMSFQFDLVKESELDPLFFSPTTVVAQTCADSSMRSDFLEDKIHQVHDLNGKEDGGLGGMDDVLDENIKRTSPKKKRRTVEAVGKQKVTKEERARLMEEKKQKKEQEKLHKAALKAEAAEIKKLEKEKQKWEKGKFALQSIVAEIDAKVIELLSVGGPLLSRFAEKGLTYRVTSNPIEKSILWKMTVPEQISQLSSKGIEVSYILLVYEAEEFCNLVTSETLIDHVASVRSSYPSYTICYATNRLMAYINKREQKEYKNPTGSSGWRRPPIEEVLSKLATHFHRVHSRQCIDEAELAEHVVGLTCSLASCQFRKKLTRLSVNANGSSIPKDCDRNLIKKNIWLRALVAIPKVQPRFAMAIWKKYPTMKSLLSIYMDPNKSVHEKEFLLKDLMTEGSLGNTDRRLGEVCSKRVYRILMAQNAGIKTDDVEDGADFF